MNVSSADMFHFSHMGHMAGSTGFGHLVFDFNVTKFILEIESTCHHVKRLWSGKFTPRNPAERRRVKILTALAAECHVFLVDVQEYEQIWFLPRGTQSSFESFQNRPLRPRRQLFLLGTLAGAGIVSMFSSLFSGSFLSGLSGRVDDQTDTTISILQEDEVRLSSVENSEKMLNASLLILGKVEQGMRNEIGATGATILTITAFSTRLSEFQRIFGCLQGLTDNKISPQLFNISVLPTALHKLQAQMTAQDYRLALDQIPDLFKCETSYISFTNGLIRIFVHIPAYRLNTLMRVYRFIPIPFEIPDHLGGEHFTMTRPARNILAVSDDEADYQILSDAEWAACSEFLGIKFCPDANLYRKGTSAICLMAVYKKDIKAIHDKCRFSISPTETFALNIDGHSVIIFHSTLSEIRLTCLHPRRSEKAAFKGLRRVTIPPACRLQGNHFLFDASLDLYADPLYINPSFMNLSSLFAGPDNYELSDLQEVYHLLAQVGSKEGLTIADVSARYQKIHHQSLFNWGLGSFSGFLAIVLLTCFVGLLARRYFRRRNRHREEGNLNVHLELNPLATSPAAARAASTSTAHSHRSRALLDDDDE